MDLPTPGSPETGQADTPLSGSPESCQQQHSPPHEEPGFVPEEDIPDDGPDPEGQKMIEELAASRATAASSGL